MTLKDDPTYHIDYVFMPPDRAAGLREMTVGSFEDWCVAGLGAGDDIGDLVWPVTPC